MKTESTTRRPQQKKEKLGTEKPMIVVDESIFCKGEPKGFTPTGYIYSAHHQLFKKVSGIYRRKHKIKESSILSDSQRHEVDEMITLIIKNGKISVVVSAQWWAEKKLHPHAPQLDEPRFAVDSMICQLFAEGYIALKDERG